MPDVTIEVEGLKQLRKDLAAVNKALPKELGQLYKSIGTMVIQDAQNRAFGLGGVANKAASALSASARSTAVVISLNGQKYPYALGAEFGGSQPQFKPWRGNGPDAGYFLYPTIRADSQEILDAFDAAAAKAYKLAFPKK